MPQVHSGILPKKLLASIPDKRPHTQVSQILIDSATIEIEAVFARFSTRPAGLTNDDARARRARYGPNVLAKDQRTSLAVLLWHAVINPLVILLAVLASISFATGDPRAGIVMSVMIALGVGLRLIQEAKAGNAAAKLKAMISVTATVIRDGKAQEIAVSQLVPGDMVNLAAGDMIPADVRVVAAKDLFVTQSSLTGETFPVEKFAVEKDAATTASDRSDQYRIPRHERRKRLGDRGCRRHRERDISGRHRPFAVGGADGDGLRQGHHSVHLVDAAIHSDHGAPGLHHQWPDQGQLG